MDDFWIFFIFIKHKMEDAMLLLDAFSAVLNFFRGWDPTVKIVVLVALVFVFMYTLVKMLKAKDGLNYGWLFIMIAIFAFSLFYVYAVY